MTVFGETQGYRCGIDVQSFYNHWFIKTLCFFIDLFMVGVSLEQFVNNAMDIDGFI